MFFQLWFYNKASLAYLLKVLRKIQRAAIWILEAFYTSLTSSIKAITSLISIYLYLQKLRGRFQLRTQSLPLNHIIKFILESRHSDSNSSHCLLLKKLTSKQQLNIKGPIIDANNRLNRVFHSFSPRDRLIDIYSSCFSFHSSNRKSKESGKMFIQKLNKLILQVPAKSKMAVGVLDTCIKN